MTEGARADLIAIGDYIAQDNPLRALSFVDELEMRCTALGDSPHAYALLPNRKASGIRRAVHGRYGIFYTVRPQAVYVLHVLNSSMDYETVLFPGS